MIRMIIVLFDEHLTTGFENGKIYLSAEFRMVRYDGPHLCLEYG